MKERNGLRFGGRGGFGSYINIHEQVSDFNEYCTKQKLSARCVRKHLAELEAIRTVKSGGKVDYTCTVYEAEKNATFRRYVCIYSDWRERIKGGGAN